MFAVRIDGLPMLERQLDEIDVALRAPVIARALHASAMMHTESTWKRLAPVLTGNYRRSIHTAIVYAGYDNAKVEVGTDIVDPPYPWFLEVGTSRRGARPSARPAFDATFQMVARDAARFIDAQIARYAP